MQLIHQTIQTLLSPRQTFQELTSSSAWRWQLFPVQLGILALVIWFFYQGMSLPHLVEQQLLHAGAMTPAEKEQASAMLGQMASNMSYIAPAMAVVTSIVITSLTALYLMMFSRFDKRYHYSDWFHFAVWTQLPQLVNLAGLVILIALAPSPDMPLTLANYASVNQLFGIAQPGDSSFNLLESMNLFYLWQILLVATGLQRWLGMPQAMAYVGAALPYVLIFGLCAL